MVEPRPTPRPGSRWTSPFTIQPAPRLHAGAGAISHLAEEVDVADGRDLVLLTDAGVRAAGVADLVGEALRPLGRRIVVVDTVPPNPTPEAVEDAAGRLRSLDHPVVVAVGGGSVLDAAKALALVLSTGLDIATLADPEGLDDAALDTPARPLLAVPTTAGTGAETNGFAVLTDPQRHRKVYVGDHRTVPTAAVLDPALTIGVPAAVTASTGMDALTHALESLASRNTNPIAATEALRTVELVFAHLPRACERPEDLAARGAMLLAAHLAGRALTATGLGVAHAIGHALSNRHGTAHGVALASVLPTVLAHNAPAAQEPFDAAHDIVRIDAGPTPRSHERGAPTGAATDEDHPLVLLVGELSAAVGTDRRLRDLGVAPADIELLAADAVADPVIDNNPLTITTETAARLIRACH